jgi:hypothetical protein
MTNPRAAASQSPPSDPPAVFASATVPSAKFAVPDFCADSTTRLVRSARACGVFAVSMPAASWLHAVSAASSSFVPCGAGSSDLSWGSNEPTTAALAARTTRPHSSHHRLRANQRANRSSGSRNCLVRALAAGAYCLRVSDRRRWGTAVTASVQQTSIFGFAFAIRRCEAVAPGLPSMRLDAYGCSTMTNWGLRPGPASLPWLGTEPPR